MKTMTYPYSTSAFDSLFRADPFELLAPFFEYSTRSRTTHSTVEWFEDDSNYFAKVDFPGVSKDQVTLEVEDDLVTFYISEEKGDGDKEKNARREKKLRIPEGIDPSAISATMSDGVLTLTLPKTPEKQPVRISIS